MGRRKKTTNILKLIHVEYPDLTKIEMAKALNMPRQQYHRYWDYPDGPGPGGNRFPVHLIPLLRTILEQKVGISKTKFYELFENSYPPYPND